MAWNTFRDIPFDTLRRKLVIALISTTTKAMVCFMLVALNPACTKRILDEGSADLQRQANALVVTSLKQTVETLIKGLNRG
jgi:hypothetical protein